MDFLMKTEKILDMTIFVCFVVLAFFALVTSGCTAHKLRATLAELDAHQTQIEQACDIAVAVGALAEQEQLTRGGEQCQNALARLSDAEKTTAGQMVLCVVRDKSPQAIETCANEVDWMPVGQKIRKFLE